MNTVPKYIQILPNGEITVESTCVFTEDDLKFLQWCIDLRDRLGLMNTVEKPYFKDRFERVTRKIEALQHGTNPL